MKIPVSLLINTDQLPEELNFITGGINNALTNIFYEDYKLHRKHPLKYILLFD